MRAAPRRNHVKFRVYVCFCVLFCVVPHLSATAEIAAAAPENLSPSRQPLLVLRLADPGTLLDLLAGSGAQPVVDFAGRLPGLGAEVASATDFLEALAATGARDVWYCLLPGEGLSRPVAGMGWRLPAGKETTPAALAAWLEGAGLPVGARELSAGGGRSPAAGGQRVVVGPDDGTLWALTGGNGPERWRRELAAFMAEDEGAAGPAPTLGVWANPRPLLGLASVFGGFDARGALARLGLSVPEAVELALRSTADGGGGEKSVLCVRLARVLPGRSRETAPGPGQGLELLRPAGALLQIHIPGPAASALLPRPALWEYLPLLNIEQDGLEIQAASLAVWRGREGGLRWLAGALFPDAEGFARNWRRALAAAGDLPGVAEVRDGALGLRLGGTEVWLRPARINGSAAGEDAVPGAVLAAASRTEDLPDAVEPIKTMSGDRDVAARWSARLDGAAREELAEELARLIAKTVLGRKFSAGELLNGIPVREAGEITLDGDSVVVTSQAAGETLVKIAGFLR